ncbi:MAG: TIGR04282 family arsenosugar biosynthesis glycosyltransferase [Proteobacteria bacterium]|nr:TIGR04282 family arsenosugar biosynthesis glycosyltransferase [Pseudomonadota bacterium]MBU1716916.1 TIGR04282 family arsenosugar biosynthesis glycosyltransferase [Pseudomonadota bacterium]
MNQQSNNYREKIIIFTRYPKPGASKTRLIPALGAEGAANLQKQMTEQIIRQARLTGQHRQAELEVRFTGASKAEIYSWLPAEIPCLPQGKGDLGDRLARAFMASFTSADKTITVGADCPALTHKIITKALDHLTNFDLVLGPAHDGGYYLIGLKDYQPELFNSIPWGTEEVLTITIARAKKKGLSIFQLETLFDVDRPEDIRHFNNNSSD